MNHSVLRNCDGRERIVSHFSLLQDIVECGYITMESLVPYASVVLLITNGFILFRHWPTQKESEPNIRKFIALIDPLVAAILCPLASDLYFTSEWASGCSTTYTMIIVAVTFVLYVCSLTVCYRLIELAFPSHPSGVNFNPSSQRLPATPAGGCLGLTFAWSMGLNFALTWFLLPLMAKVSNLKDNFDSEMCQPFFITRMMVYVFASSCAVQVAYIALYFCVCKSNLYGKECDIPGKRNTSYKSNMKTLILYTLTTLVCLITTCLLRFIFMTCSCEGLFVLSRSFPAINFLLGLKLPFASLLKSFSSQIHNKIRKLDP
ncbi:hypothetical protein PoB_004788400 [Plakobranchus ocellatus]|uniref:G-protein coupled receptors family 1 profile domain-containing protein n=1 Tax=Plakobranchus ocellatus TaxID=259542 RepID=A0AAV4BMN4_9GAST|nr:hypothetical protein PoB_004788400 [Plakobranchus ocellatus]